MRRQVHGRRQPRPAPGGALQGEWGPGVGKGSPGGLLGGPGAPQTEQRLPQPLAPSTCGCRWQGTACACITHCSALLWVLLCLILGTCWRYSSWRGAAGASAPFLAVPALRGCRQGGVCAPQGVLAAGSWGGIQQPVMQGRSRITQSYRRSAPRKVPLPVFFWLSAPLASPSRRGGTGQVSEHSPAGCGPSTVPLS